MNNIIYYAMRHSSIALLSLALIVVRTTYNICVCVYIFTTRIYHKVYRVPDSNAILNGSPSQLAFYLRVV